MSVGGLVIPALLQGHEWISFTNEDLAIAALIAARAKGVAYADVRITRGSKQTYEVGIRALVNGSWGFASTGTMTKEAIINCAEEAVANATQKSSSGVQKRHQYDLSARHEVWRCTSMK